MEVAPERHESRAGTSAGWLLKMKTRPSLMGAWNKRWFFLDPAHGVADQAE